MKKIFLGIVIVLVIIFVGCLGFKFVVSSKIESKIAELNSNGFVVKHEQNSQKFKTFGSGQIEVIYPDKVASYLFNKIEDKDLKKSLEKQFSLLDRTTKDELFEGVTFDYDFVINNITSKLDLNVYLTKLSTRTTYNLAQTYSYYANTQKVWFDELLKEKKLHLNIDEKGNYKLSDINFVIPNKAFFTFRDILGNKSNMKIGLVKISDVYNDAYTKGSLVIDNIDMDYVLNKDKKTSKINIGNLEFADAKESFKIKNLTMDSNSLIDKENISGNSKISFDEVVVGKTAILNKTSMDISFDKIPFKKYEEMMDSLYSNNVNFEKQYDEFLKALSQNGITLSSKGEATNYVISEKKYFDILKYDATLSLNKNIPSIKDIKSIKDIFEVIKFTVDMDNESATNLINDLSKSDVKFTFVDTEDKNIKRFETELKTDGIYINGIKALDEKELEFPSKNYDTLSYDGISGANTQVTSSYELINDNLLRVSFKYTPNMEVISAGGIAVSFPQLKDASKIKAHNTKSFDKIDYYIAGNEIYSGMLGENVKAEYLMVEGWDENWTDPKATKEFSLDIDITDMKNSYLEINLRGGALNETDSTKKYSELAPDESQSFTKDQQSYPVNIADIDLYTITNGGK